MPDARNIMDEAARYQAGGALDRALERYREVVDSASDPAIVAEALRRIASVHRTRCDWDAALESARRSQHIADRAGRMDLVAEALNAQAVVHQSRGDWDQAVRLLERALEQTDAPRLQGIALQNLGFIAASRGDMKEAESKFQESYDCFRAAGYRRGEATAVINYGRAAIDTGQRELAVAVCTRAVDAAKSTEDLSLLALARMNLAEAMAMDGRFTEALELATTALGFFSSTKDLWRQVEALRLMGDLHREEENAATSKRCYTRALELARQIGAQAEIPALEERMELVSSPPPTGTGDDG